MDKMGDKIGQVVLNRNLLYLVPIFLARSAEKAADMILGRAPLRTARD
jgi:hypothetical protein